MLKLQQLLRGTPSNIIRNSREVRSRIVRSVLDVDEIGPHKRVLIEARATDGIRYLIYKFYEPEKKNLAQSKCYVHCSCPYFLYFLEVALTARGTSSVINSNGQYPRVRNPRLRPYLCKHLFAGSRAAMRSTAKKAKGVDVVDEHEIQRLLQLVSDLIPDKA